ncbi:MAG: 5-formyltetrahydrofolate cyclo-ligase [Bacteroidales bacterium]|nr:5-formyltetrahydrofolate cyclo-ligase [Bacteroidales bacterium]
MIDNKKSEIRNYIRELKKQFPLEVKKQKSESIFKKLEQLDVFSKSKIIMSYWSMDDEVYTHDFILKWHNKKKIVLPVVKGNELELKSFSGLDNLIKGESYGIEEPSGDIFDQPEKIDLIIVSGIAFDKTNNRLGRGKAYYDKLLKSTKANKIGVCFDFQFLASIPVDKHDIKMDLVISDN